MMKIKLDDKHYLISDPCCYWIVCEVSSTKGKQKTYEKRVSGYCGTFEQAVESFIDKMILSSEADTLKKLKQEIEDLKKTVRGWKVVLKGVIEE
jgi:hypothetical protein|nr:MAG TPA: protein of unknown function (DUF5405) [Caudoviricetes sp.]